MADTPSGFVLVCDPQGTIVRVVCDDLGVVHDGRVGAPFAVLLTPETAAKAGAFFSTLRSQAAAFDWELTLDAGEPPTLLHVTGVAAEQGTFLIIAATTRGGVDRLYEDLLQVNNEQATTLRAAMKERSIQILAAQERDGHLYDELTRLNNELATAQRQLAKQNAELERLNAQKNQFLGMAAHDLRNPLGAIKTYSELLLDDVGALTEEQIESVSVIRSQSEYMLRLVNDLLDIAKIDAGRLDLQLTDVDLVGLVTHSVGLDTLVANKKRIRLVAAVGAAPLYVSADAGKIQQVLHNLIDNAIKFSQPETTVTVRMEPRNGIALITVSDQGPGIPVQERARIFAPFERTSVKSTGGELSTGLGLAIVRKMVEGHGGRIWVESEVGCGSTFYVSLPLRHAQEATHAER